MAIWSAQPHQERQIDKYSLAMDQPERNNESEHVIDIRRSVEVASSSSVHGRISDDNPAQNEDRPSSSARASISQLSLPLPNISNSRNSSFSRRGNGNGHARRRRSPLNSVLWISVELVLILAQILASIIVLSLSRHEHPHTPLFAWILGYAGGCVVTLPLLYWRYLHRNQGSEEDSTQSHQGSSGSSSVGHYFPRNASQAPEDDSRTSNRSPSGLIARLRNNARSSC